MKYFGIGLQKTGTTTLGGYFAACGLKRFYGGDVRLTHAVLTGNYDAMDKRIRRYDAFEDAPWFMVYERIYDAYPESKFIHTIRSTPEKWLASCRKHCQNYGPSYPFKQTYGFPTPVGHETEFLRAYETHNQQARQFFADKPGRYLEVCVEDPGAHAALAEFLGKSERELPRIWSNPGSGGSFAGSSLFKLRSTAVYYTRCVLAALKLPMR